MDTAREMFVKGLDQLLAQLSNVFPQCPGVKDVKEEFDVIFNPTQRGHVMLIEMWHKEMKVLYDACRRKDGHVFINSDLAILKRLRLADKWLDPGFTDQHKEVLWKYINYLNNCAQSYHSSGVEDSDVETKSNAVPYDEELMKFVPPGLQDRLIQLNEDLASKAQRGEFQGGDPSQVMSVIFGEVMAMQNEVSENDRAALEAAGPMLIKTIMSRPDMQDVLEQAGAHGDILKAGLGPMANLPQSE